ncbi:hypothetical protein D3C73_1345290 [compost metagenome]
MAVAEKPVGIALCSIVVIQPDRIHHPQKITVVSYPGKRLQEQQIQNKGAAGNRDKNLCFE